MSLLLRFLPSRAERERSSRAAAIAEPIIARLLDATDQRLAFVKGYRKTLRAPVMAAREHLGVLIARIPGPAEVGAMAWAQDPTVRALFARAGDASRAWVNDAGTQAFFAAHPASDCVAMLALLQTERRVLAAALHGDSVQAEVARTTVSFSDPQVLAPAPDEAASRNELVMRAFEYLAMRALERVGRMRAERRELEKERELLRARLQLARRRGAGFGAVGGPDGGGAAVADVATLERDLARTVADLEQSASRNLLPALLEELVAVLSESGKYLAIEPSTVALDPMNFAVPGAPAGAVVPRTATLRLAERGPFAVLLARFPRAELRPPENRFADAAKYL
jgi:hypothetical protein